MRTKQFALVCLIGSPVLAHAAYESPEKAWAAMSMTTRCVESTTKGEDCTTEERTRILSEAGRHSFGTKTLTARKSQHPQD